jgi:hypothetical protein
LEDLILNDTEIDHHEENSTKRDTSLLYLEDSEENDSSNLHLDETEVHFEDYEFERDKAFERKENCEPTKKAKTNQKDYRIGCRKPFIRKSGKKKEFSTIR